MVSCGALAMTTSYCAVAAAMMNSGWNFWLSFTFQLKVAIMLTLLLPP